MIFQEVQEVKETAKEATEKITEKITSWWDTLILNLPNILIALVVLIVSYFISRLIFKASFKLLRSRVQQVSVAKLMARTMSIITVLAGLFIALSVLDLGESITGLLTGAGISGIVIGLALQGTLSNTISGIALSFRHKISHGDWVETNGYSGRIEDIALNYLVLKEADNNVVVIPNRTIIENPFKNLSLTPRIRITIECGVGYESDLEKVKEITKQAIVDEFELMKDKKSVEFFYTDFANSSINYVCRFWINGKDEMDKLKAKSSAIMKIKSAYDKHEINIPFPIRTLNFNSNLSDAFTHRQNNQETKD